MGRALFVPYFMGHRERESAQLVDSEVIEPDLPDGSDQQRMAALYRVLAERVAAGGHGGVQVGDCTATLGVAAGLQRRGVEPSLVWFDAHGDFNTWETTPSGFIGGMPLAMMVGRGEQTIVEGAGLTPLPETRVYLVGTRDLDPGERTALDASAVTEVAGDELDRFQPPPGPLYVHLDIDLVRLEEMPAVNYPAPGGPFAATVRGALERLFATGRVEAFSVTCWDPEKPGADISRATAERLLTGFL